MNARWIAINRPEAGSQSAACRVLKNPPKGMPISHNRPWLEEAETVVPMY
jgi:hypothetical protein